MDLTVIVFMVLALIQGGVYMLYLFNIPKYTLFVLPASFILFSDFTNYFLRSLYLSLWDPYRINVFSIEEITQATLYVTMFVAILVGTFLIILKRIFTPNEKVNRLWGDIIPYADRSHMAVHVAFLLLVASIIYRMATGKMFGYLGENLLKPVESNTERIMMMAFNLSYFIIPYTLVTLYQKIRIVPLVECIVSVAIILLISITSSAKGFVANLILVYFYCQAICKKKISIIVMVLFGCMGFAFSTFSYMMRSTGKLSGESSAYLIYDNLIRAWDASQDPTAVQYTGIASTMERFSYLDPLMLMMTNRITIPAQFAEEFQYGGMMEFVAVLPRFIWPDRPRYGFNLFMTRAVWGIDADSETPVGRIGESFYVAGYLGLFYAVVYGAFSAGFFLLFRRRLNDPFYIGLYYCMIMVYIYPDAHISNGIQPFLYFPAFLLPLNYLANMSASRPPARAWPNLARAGAEKL